MTSLWTCDVKMKQNLHGPQRQQSAQLVILNLKLETEGEKKCRPTITCGRENGIDKTLETTTLEGEYMPTQNLNQK